MVSRSGPAVIVKIYDPNSDLKVCDVCDFVGVLSLDQPQGMREVVSPGDGVR